MGLKQVRVIIIPMELELLHFPNVIHDSKLLRQICFHPLLNHVSASHVFTHASLQNLSISKDHDINLSEPVHPEV